MGRPREFNENEALESAMQVFWVKGYDGASLGELTSAMGLSKSSLYDTFGSKHELFIAAVERYKDTAQSDFAATLEGDLPAREAIETVFNDFVAHATGERRGCFLNKCVVERGPDDSEADACVKEGMARVEQAFRSAVRRGQETGDIATRHDAPALARYLNAGFQGLVVMSKAGASRAELGDVVRITLVALD